MVATPNWVSRFFAFFEIFFTVSVPVLRPKRAGLKGEGDKVGARRCSFLLTKRARDVFEERF
jgi:hypothetical protein